MPTSAKSDSTIYLVQEELALLTPASKKKWEKSIVMETLTAYETPEQIDARMRAVNYSKYPKVQKVIDACLLSFKQGNQPDFSLESFPREAINSFLYSIGASGISAYIDMFLRSKSAQENPETMDGIADLTRARHAILEKNQAVFA